MSIPSRPQMAKWIRRLISIIIKNHHLKRYHQECREMLQILDQEEL